MRPSRTTGLVGAGSVCQSFLARLPSLLVRLGPVKGISIRTSRRIANTLRAGSAVADYSEFESCEAVWISVPENQLEDLSDELAQRVDLDGKRVVFCDSLRDSRQAGALRRAGARVVSLNPVPETQERVFVAEGDGLVMAELRKLLAADQRTLTELRPSSKPLYLSGVNLALQLLLPWIGGAVESLRAAGFSRMEATRLVHTFGSRALRAYCRAGDKAWNPQTQEGFQRALEQDLELIGTADRRLAILHSQGMECAHQFFSRKAPRKTETAQG